jgi:cell division protein FtsA
MILEQLASSYAVLSPDEKALGVCLIDIGGGTTDIAVMINGAVRHSAVIPIAGDQVTNDLAIALHTTTAAAEHIKLACAAVIDHGEGADVCKVPSMNGHTEQEVSIAKIIEIVSARYEEIFTYVWSELKRHGLHESIPAGIVMTGGGAKVRYGAELAEKIFNQPVRVASPLIAEHYGFDATYSTAVGLMLHAVEMQHPSRGASISGQGWWKKIRQWAKANL